MTIVFFSNFLTLHQTAFCEAMVRLLGGGFRFVATERLPEERHAMGYEDLSHSTSYVVNSYESSAAYDEAMRLGLESDVVIIGSASDDFIKERLKHNKLTFRYSERFFKKGFWRIFDPRVFRYRFTHDFMNRNKKLYMLCASAYTASDCRFIFSYPGKTFKWGYFPEVKKYDERKLMAGKQHNKPVILWVGRLIKLKHPEYAISLAHELSSKGFDFDMLIIGEGPLRQSLERKTKELGMDKLITFKDFMPQSEVRRHMEQANIFIFTSDRQEGWGAVLNEAMNSGCAVVANDEIGSVPFLIKDGYNGLTYHRDVKKLSDKVEILLKDSAMVERLGLSSYHTIKTDWNADAASVRLLKLIESINLTENYNVDYGPISKA